MCTTCYPKQEIRQRYGPIHNSPLYYIREDFVRLPPLPEPTDAPPGSESKVAVLEQRASKKLALFHPHDPVIVWPLGYVWLPREHRRVS